MFPERSPSAEARNTVSQIRCASFSTTDDNKEAIDHSASPSPRSPPLKKGCLKRSAVPTNPMTEKEFTRRTARLLRYQLQRAARMFDLKQKEKEELNESIAHIEKRTCLQQELAAQMEYPGVSVTGNAVTTDAGCRQNLAALLAPNLRHQPTFNDGDMMDIDENDSHSSLIEDEGLRRAATSAMGFHHQQDNEGVVLHVERNSHCLVEKAIASTKRGLPVDGLLTYLKATAEYDKVDF
ncbi:hypothetical protein VTO42DRAFT_8955 [Malbranchea cinnamomea]